MNDQEKRKLMIKAAVKFKGKWPDVAEDQDCLIASKNHGEIRVSMINSKDIHEELNKFDFDFFGTQTEFEAFMDDLADKAPVGAEFYSPKQNDFIGRLNNEWMFSIGKAHNWHKLSPKSVIDERELIPLPAKKAQIISDTSEQLKEVVKSQAPYIPNVDVKCLGNVLDKITLKYSYQEVIPLRDIGAEWVVQTVKGSHLSYCDEFRPLRTESEIERQALYDSLCELDADLDDYQINCLIEFIQGRDND